MSLATWYASQYGNRTRPGLLVNADNRTTTVTMAQTSTGDVVINMDPSVSREKEKKEKESLFGPNIGIVSNGPSWTVSHEKKVLSDELTQDVVKNWVEKSKNSSQPATTLQALVNLKRPTLRLSPLTAAAEDTANTSNTHHGLEFEYDCDSAKCGIYLHVLLPSDHPDAPTPSSSKSGLSKLLVFETVVDGGFGRVLKLDDGAILDLHRFEATKNQATSADSVTPTAPNDPTSPAAENTLLSPTTRSRRRFTAFNFRRRHDRGASGPALAVVDADTSGDKKENDAEGVKVTIRLAALDAHGTELAAPNEQVTYLHIVRFGAKAATSTSAVDSTDKPEEGDNRPWVVQVVKREATIGAHTFHLHEIYGLTSTSTSTPAPTAPVPTEPTTYPPATPSTATPLLNQAASPDTNDEPTSECLVCLSSPREVVLLPCRHLVACKDCALNMVEFGAGGSISHTEEPVSAAPGGDDPTTGDAPAEGAASTSGTATTPAPAAATTPALAARRKRKAKGWYCPVCRQPYTSLLRITTTAPPPPPPTNEDAAGKETSGLKNETTTPASAPAPESPRQGLLASIRPNFLRTFSSNRPNNDASSQV